MINTTNYHTSINETFLTSSLQGNTSSIGYDENEVYRIARIILVFMFTSNIVGNISVLCIMWGTGRKRRMRFFIMNLAITDLFVAIGGILPELIMSVTINFYAPDIICRLVKYMSITATYASSFALVVLSFDRAEAVINPLRSAQKTCFGVMRPTNLAICGWITAALCGIPGMILSHLVTTSKGPNCYLDFSYISPRAYLTSVAVTVFLLPAFFITLCHVAMVARIWQAAAAQNRELVPSREQPNLRKFACVQPSSVVGIREEIEEEDDTLTGRRKSYRLSYHTAPTTSPKTGFLKMPISSTSTGCIPRARVKTVKMTFVIVSVYIMCWCPYMIWNLLVTFGILGTHTPNFMKISPLIQHLVTLNSSANPVIFWIFSAHTILTERRKNRRSKVVQRHHRRWKCTTTRNNRVRRGDAGTNLNEDTHLGNHHLHKKITQTNNNGIEVTRLTNDVKSMEQESPLDTPPSPPMPHTKSLSPSLVHSSGPVMSVY